MQLAISAQLDHLVERCKKGEALGYKELYERYSKAMFNTCARILNNLTEAEDVLQESFIEAFKNLDHFEYRTSFGGWLKQICINRSINQLKKRKNYWVDIKEADNFDKAEEAGIDEEDIQFRVDAIKKAMMSLPDGYRTILTLYLLEGYDHAEIAGILNVAESTTRTQYMRAKQKLLTLLKDEL